MNVERPVPPRPDTLHPAPPTGPPVETAGGLPLATWGWWEALGVYLLAFLIGGLSTVPIIGAMGEDDETGIIFATLVAALVIIGVLMIWLRRRHPRWRSIMGLPMSRHPWTDRRFRSDVRAGVLFSLGLYPVIVIVIGGLLLVLFKALSGESVEAPEQISSNLPAIGVAITVVYALVVAPFGEELFFRGVLFRALRDRHGFAVGAIGSGIGFGLIHYIPGPALDSILLMTVMVFTGIGFAFIADRRRTLVASIAAHVTFNAIGLVLIFAIR